MKTDNLTSSFMALREKLHRSAMGFLRNDEDACDALQDTFFRLWSKGPVETDSEARNKLFAVLRNVCIDRLRRPPSVSIGDCEVESLSIEPDSGEDMEKFERLLTSGLTEMQLRIYRMVTHDGEEYEAVASVLGMTPEAVRMNMSRARRKIRENYKALTR